MSNTLKGVIAILAIIAVAGLYLLKQNEARFQAEFSPHQGLESALSTGRVELKSFHDWCVNQGYQGQDLDDCVQKRKAKAKQLLELEKQSQAQPENPNTPPVNTIREIENTEQN